jgi:hypothetical protein
MNVKKTRSDYPPHKDPDSARNPFVWRFLGRRGINGGRHAKGGGTIMNPDDQVSIIIAKGGGAIMNPDDQVVLNNTVYLILIRCKV